MQRVQLVWAADRWIGGVAHFPGPRLFPVKEAKNMTESEYQWQIRANEARISEAAAGIARRGLFAVLLLSVRRYAGSLLFFPLFDQRIGGCTLSLGHPEKGAPSRRNCGPQPP